MRNQTMMKLRAVAELIQRIVAVRMPVGAMYGLQTHRRD
jgi:hypothetical protein